MKISGSKLKITALDGKAKIALNLFSGLGRKKKISWNG